MLKVFLLAILLALSSSARADEDPSRGIGIYPGNPAECFAPTLVGDTTFRNLALNRRAWHSSSHDYNLTAQLVTDGYTTSKLGFWWVETSEGPLPKYDRESCIDGNEYSRNSLSGPHPWIHFLWNHTTLFDSLNISVQVVYDDSKAIGGYRIRISDDDDRHCLFVEEGDDLPGELLPYRVHSDPNKQTESTLMAVRRLAIGCRLNQQTVGTVDDLLLHFDMEGAALWSITEVRAFYRGQRVDLMPSSQFCSAWMSDGGGEQWVTVDLGRCSEINQLKAFWLMAPAQWQVELSDDNQDWTTISSLNDTTLAAHQADRRCLCLEKTAVVNLPQPVYGRYVRVRATADNCLQRYALSELEVWGRGGLVAQEHPVEGWRADGTYSLNGGAWRLRHEWTNYGGLMEQLSQEDTSEGRSFGGIVATVPATVLTSYLNVEAIPDPNYDDDLMMISESFFRQPFIYRTTFQVPDELLSRRHVMLHFDGINWKADVWLNGHCLGRIEGAFHRGLFDATRWLKAGNNVLAVRIVNNQNYGGVKEKTSLNTGFNGGILGADNPTFHASVGWDWISTVRGRNMGIWNDVYLSANDGVSIGDPLLLSKVEDVKGADGTATMTPTVVVRNHTDSLQQIGLRGWIGDIQFERPVALQPYEEREVAFSPDDFPQLKNRQMHLWWPNGYGIPYLYKAGFEITSHLSPLTSHLETERLEYRAGIRQVTYSDTLTALKLYINGRRFVPLGGNWGFSEHNLSYRGREYDIAVDYHRQMNFTMIRNWVGQTGDDEFYEACDRNGIMVWQDFWLANPSDGPDPDDELMFMRNATDYLKRIRRHPCIALYCGRNEGYPPATLNEQLRQLVGDSHPDMVYIPSSADDGVGGHGPYNALPIKEYFRRPMAKLHTERGMPNVMNYESLCRTLRPEHLWPQNNFWGQHDFTMKGAQRGETFNELVKNMFGWPDDAKTFTQWAQWVNYEGYRAMFESNNLTRSGLIIWMSHPAFPSMVWQTYDYFFDPTAAFFACKKACEPLHVQWNALTDSVELVNTRGGTHRKLRVGMEIYDMNGQLLKQQQKKVRTHEDSTLRCMKVKQPKWLTDVWFLRLVAKDEQGNTLSENTYVRSADDQSWQALLSLPKAHIATTIQWEKESCRAILRNDSPYPALMLRLNLKSEDGEQILPVSYSESYFHLMPGEEKTVTIRWNISDTRGSQPMLHLSGMNVEM